jgi:tRNA (adenine37-N6)-methyltransferase
MAKTMAEFSLKPIGYFKGTHQNKSAVPRQGHLSQQVGVIKFEKNFDAKLALKGLEKMSHLWIIFQFHQAQSKPKPLVSPPRAPDIQVGVWATRSPYRPNSLGLTLAKIIKIEGSSLFLSEVDLLDGTPIFDLKPYVTDSDRPQNPKLGWIDDIEVWKYTLSKKAKTQITWLKENGLTEVDDVLESQFGTPPLQLKRKRVKKEKDFFVLSYRTWRFSFNLDISKKRSQIKEIKSGYSSQELELNDDPYSDKKLHKTFLKEKF